MTGKRRRSTAVVPVPRDVMDLLGMSVKQGEKKADTVIRPVPEAPEAQLADKKEAEKPQVIVPVPDVGAGVQRLIMALPQARIPDLENFNAEHDTRLSIASVQLIVVASLLAVLSFYLQTVYGQSAFERSTLVDLMWPVMIVSFAGMVGLGLILRHYGVHESLYNSFFIPPGIIVILMGIWSVVVDASEPQKFAFSRLVDPRSLRAEHLMWLGIIVLALVWVVNQYVRGNMRLDAIDPASKGFLAFVVVSYLLSYGLARVFGLAIRTIDHNNFKKDTPEYFFTYVLAVGMVSTLIMAVFHFLDASLTLFSGNVFTMFPPSGVGIGARLGVVKTRLAFRTALFVVIMVTATLMWRRREALEAGSDTSESLKNEWLTMLLAFLITPVVAAGSEFLMKYTKTDYFTFYVLRLVTTAGVVIMIGAAIVPWNEITYMLYWAFVLFMILQYVTKAKYRGFATTSFLCASSFVFARLMYVDDINQEKLRLAKKNKRPVQEQEVGPIYKMTSWLQRIVLTVALISFFTIQFDDWIFVENSRHVAYVFLAFSAFYTLQVPYFSWPFGFSAFVDDPEDQTIPGNWLASQTVDAIILAAVLWVFTHLYTYFKVNEPWSKWRPVPVSPRHQVVLGATFGFVTGITAGLAIGLEPVDGALLGIMAGSAMGLSGITWPGWADTFRGLIMGYFVTLYFSMIRKNQLIRLFFSQSQWLAEENFRKLQRDAKAMTLLILADD